MIEVEHLTKRFGATVAVNDVSFTVMPGEVVGFLGPNGAGKTTTMRVLTGLIYPQSGTARVNGKDIWEHPVEVRRALGYLPESTPLYEEMCVTDFLRFIASVRGIPPGNVAAKIDEMVEVCSLQTMAYKDISELSRGYRQRVGLAQALIHDPPVLILDEPTSGLDPTQILEIRKLVRKLGQTKAILFSTHILDEASKTCDRILIISDGKLVGEGSPQDLATMSTGESTYSLEIKGDADAFVSSLPEQFRLAGKSAEGDRILLELVSTDAADRSEELFDLAAAAGCKLLRLNRKEASLEDVFLRLTKGGKA
jgi:ABC-2 type transport system ATP-binding protein